MLYDLFFGTGPSRFRWRLVDHGVELGETTLRLHGVRDTVEHAYVEVAEVRLTSNAIGGRPGLVGNCDIRFRDGSPRIVVSNTGSSGLADRNRTEIYWQFVVDLHKRLVVSDAIDRMAFRAGFSRTRHTALIVSLAVAAALFLGLPLTLYFATGDAQALWIMLCGVFLLLPAMRLVRPNRPRSYDPRLPPDLLR